MTTYERLRHRCIRVVGLHPDSKESLRDCIEIVSRRGMSSSSGLTFALLAENMANFIERDGRDGDGQ